MHAKQLERFIESLGGSPASVDAVVRKLREAFKVSTGGRGMNARHLDVAEITWILAAYAGSEIASRADETLERLFRLMTPHARYNDFLANLQLVVRGEICGVREVRICKNFPLAWIIYDNGTVHKFALPEHQNDIDGLGGAMFRSEGVLSGGLLSQLRIEISDDSQNAAWVGEE